MSRTHASRVEFLAAVALAAALAACATKTPAPSPAAAAEPAHAEVVEAPVASIAPGDFVVLGPETVLYALDRDDAQAFIVESSPGQHTYAVATVRSVGTRFVEVQVVPSESEGHCAYPHALSGLHGFVKPTSLMNVTTEAQRISNGEPVEIAARVPVVREPDHDVLYLPSAEVVLTRSLDHVGKSFGAESRPGRVGCTTPELSRDTKAVSDGDVAAIASASVGASRVGVPAFEVFAADGTPLGSMPLYTLRADTGRPDPNAAGRRCIPIDQEHVGLRGMEVCAVPRQPRKPDPRTAKLVEFAMEGDGDESKIREELGYSAGVVARCWANLATTDERQPRGEVIVELELGRREGATVVKANVTATHPQMKDCVAGRVVGMAPRASLGSPSRIRLRFTYGPG